MYRLIQSTYRTLTARLQLLDVVILAAFVALSLIAQPVLAQAPTADDATSALIDIPELSSPPSGYVGTALTDPPTGVPTLRWEPVNNATRYKVQVSPSLGFSDPDEQITYATSFTPKTSLADGTYYWRVSAEVDRLWSNFSEPRSFTKDWNDEATLKPVLVEPAADAPLAAFDDSVFRWEPVPGAADYIFEISNSPTFNSDAKSDPCYYKANVFIPQHTPTKLLANTTCYWRVTPLDNQGNAGVASDIRSFTFAWNRVPVLLTPADDVDLRFLPRFTWEAVEGAKDYILEVSTQADFSSISLAITTPNTEYTPETNLGNNRDFFWRVKATNPRGVTGPTGEVRKFTLEWNRPPTLLTPASDSIISLGGIQRIYPYFSWTPVAGAERYHIQISDGTGFASLVADVTLYNATSYTQPSWKEWTPDHDYEWRVEALDAQDNTTGFSKAVKFSIPLMPPPNLVYPEQYYEADAEGMPVHSDRTIANPVFVWDTTHRYIGGNGPAAFEYPDAYELTVGPDRDFNVVSFHIITAGQAAAPTLENKFDPLVNGQLYYWKVVPLKGGVMMPGTVPFVWQTRIDTTVAQFPATDTPTLMHPRDGFIATGATPVLGWQPINGAHHYAVQISRDADFSTLFDEAHPQFVYYVPYQGHTDPMPTGFYYWRFQGRDANDNAIGNWSDPRHFTIAVDLVTGNMYDYVVPETGTLFSEGGTYDQQWSYVASSGVTETAPYNLGDLHMVQDRSLDPQYNYTWLLAFSVDPGVVGDVTYGVYIDINQQPGVGGSPDPRGKPITADSRYLPEYVLYIDRSGESIVKADFRGWKDNQWQGFDILDNVFYDTVDGAIQINLPPGDLLPAISGQETGSIAVTVFTTGSGPDNVNDGIHDSIPRQTNNTIGYPAFLSDMPTPLYPFDTPLSNPFILHDMPTVRWRMPYFDSTDGYQVQLARDIDFTEIVETWETYETESSSFYGLAPTGFHTKGAMNDEESYYWRVRYRHEHYDDDDKNHYDTGPWSPPMRFKFASYQPGAPTATIATVDADAQVTPSFYWNRVEGASGYTIQIDDDANLSSPFINKKIDGNSFTPQDTLADGTYYWRVAMRRSSTVVGQWSPILSFTKRTLTPTLLRPINDELVNQQPVFAWTPVITNSGNLRIAAPKYRLQWDDDPNFGSPVTMDTESSAYGLVDGQSLADGTWYWRVAVIDADNKVGAYTASASFRKEYLRPALISPEQNSNLDTDAVFAWSPLAGAAEYEIAIIESETNVTKKERTDSTRYTPTFDLKPTRYIWQVRMIDDDGKLGPYIDGWFTNWKMLFLPTLVR